MELILIRHAQSMFNAGSTNDLDSQLTEIGIEQAKATGQYLKENFDLTGFQGIVSPFLRTLQTAAVIRKHTELDFRVCGGPREFLLIGHPKVQSGGALVHNRSEWFEEFLWPVEHWDGEGIFYKAETLSGFIGRIHTFLGTLLEGEEKFVIVSHAAPVRAMHDLQLHDDLRALENEFDKHYTAPLIQVGEGIHNCSITHIVDGDCREFAKVAYDENLVTV